MIGELTLMATDHQPHNMILCDGRQLPMKEYSSLFSIIGFKFGGNYTTTFCIPKIDGPEPGTNWFIHATDDFPNFDY